MKTREECYNEATLKSLGTNPQGTRQDIIYLAMDIYADQFNEFRQGISKEKILEILLKTLIPDKNGRVQAFSKHWLSKAAEEIYKLSQTGGQEL